MVLLLVGRAVDKQVFPDTFEERGGRRGVEINWRINGLVSTWVISPINRWAFLESPSEMVITGDQSIRVG